MPDNHPKQRLDQILVERGLADSRTRAQALIRAGVVFSGDTRLDKPGHNVAFDIELELRDSGTKWASRGGLKLAHGLDFFDLDPSGVCALDIGASSGGFTDVLLAGGAAKVYAVDVGYGQFDWRLRQDERVVVLERTNARNLGIQHVPEPVGAVVCDASFIGLRTILPAPLALAAPDAWMVALIKPQFEVGKGQVGKGGVVRDPAQHQMVCDDIAGWLDGLPGWRVIGVEASPITGPKGNREFLIAAKRSGSGE